MSAGTAGPAPTPTPTRAPGSGKPRWWDSVLAALVFALALVPRALDLDVFLTPDETRWICRSTNFYAGLSTGDLERTYQKEHPGVATMWLGSLGMAVSPTAPYAVACRDIEPSRLVTAADRDTLDALRDRLFEGRLRVAVFVSIGIAGAYLLAARLLGRPTALLAATLLALDPLYLAQARVLHLDAVTTTLMALSLLSLLVFLLRDRRGRYLVAAGALAGLAALNKSPALFLAPFAGLAIVVHGWRSGESWREVSRRGAVWLLAAAAVYVAIWPVMWVAPAEALKGVIAGALGYAEDPHEGSNYFWGAVRPDPGPAFYPVTWLFRTTPILMLGVVAALWRLGRRRLSPVERDVVIVLGAFVVLFGLFMTTGAKKFDRYLLPVYPPLVIVATIGWRSAMDALGTPLVARRTDGRRAWWFMPGAWILPVIVSALLVLPHHPYYLSYYNPVLGGARAAEWAMLVGWGEGLEQISSFLNARPDAPSLTVATRYRSAFGPLFRGRALEMDDYDPASLDYYLLYANQVQRDLDPVLIDQLHGKQRPEAVGRFRGIEYAWLYPNRNFEPVVDTIDEHGRIGSDAIVVRSDSQLAKHYDGPLPVVTIDADADAATLRAVLEEAFRRHDRLWHVRYDDIYPRPGLAAVDYDLATRVFSVGEWRFPQVEVRLLAADAAPNLGAAGEAEKSVGAVFEVGADAEASSDARLTLESYSPSATPVRWGRDLGVATTWRLQGGPARRVTAFLHLVGPDGTRWGQVDRVVADADLRTTDRWAPGTTATDRYHLGIPAGTPPGTYRLEMGLYDSDTGERLPVTIDGAAADKISVPVEVDRPPYVPDPSALQLTEIADASMADGVALAGYGTTGAVEGGDQAPLTLVWRAEGTPSRDYRVRLTVRDVTGSVVGEATLAPSTSTFPTSQWRPGDIVRGWQSVPLDGRAQVGTGTLVAALVDEEGRAVGAPVEMHIEITGPERSYDADAARGRRIGTRVGDLADLVAADAPTLSAAGSTLPVTLTWQADRPTTLSYTVFVHLVDPSGRVVAQTDRAPSRPTTSWLPGEVVVDAATIEVPADTPAGTYRIVAGMYDPATLERLPARGRDGAVLPDAAVPLGSVEVRRR